ncbi:MAG TPA: TetR/AcrR family transcriptional regulator [Geminicoccaceae bacterium]|jgi:AcrR family transcriptional regulator
MTGPAYSRLAVDERRRQLLEAGERVFAEHAYDDVSMAEIARAAGISKGLLYHYFPSKRDLFVATLEARAQELAGLTEPDPSLPVAEQLTQSVDAYLAWIEDHAASYAKLVESMSGSDEVRSYMAQVRTDTVERILGGLVTGGDPAAVRTALHGFLWFMDGACLDWLAHRDLAREQLRDMLVMTFVGAVGAAAQAGPPVELALG